MEDQQYTNEILKQIQQILINNDMSGIVTVQKRSAAQTLVVFNSSCRGVYVENELIKFDTKGSSGAERILNIKTLEATIALMMRSVSGSISHLVSTQMSLKKMRQRFPFMASLSPTEIQKN